MSEHEPEILELKAENAALQSANDRLAHAIGEASRWLRGPLRADTLNEAIRALNAVLPRDERVNEVAWGVASLPALQRSVRDLCQIVALPEYAAFLTQRIDNQPPAPMKRQRIGGFVTHD